MQSSAAESRFGIVIQGRNESRPAYDEAVRSNQQLVATVERLISVSQQQARETHYINDALRGAAEEAKRLREEQERLAEEEEKVAAASRKAAEETRALAKAQKEARENAMAWATALFATGTALVLASNHAGDMQEKIDLIAEGTGLTAREIGALTVGASNLGRTFEDIAPSLDIFVRKLAEARRGVPEAVRVFNDAGASDLTGSTGSILQAVGTGLSSQADPTERSRVAFELFGRSFRTMSQIVTQDLEAMGDEAVRQGNVFSGAMEDVARKADTSGDRINRAISGIVNSLSVGLANTGGNALKEFFAGAAEGFSQFLAWVNRSNEELGHFQIRLKGQPGIEFKPGRLLGTQEGIGSVGFWGGAFDAPPSADRPGIGTGPMAGPHLLQNMMGTNRDAYGNLWALGPTVQEAKDALKGLTEAANQEAARRRKSALELMEFEDKVGTSPAFRPMASTDTTMLRLEREFREDRVPADLTVDALQKAREEQKRRDEEVKDAKRRTEEVMRAMQSAFTSAVSGFVTSVITGIGSVRDAFKALMRSLAQTVIETGVQLGLQALIPGLQRGATRMPALQSGATLALAASLAMAPIVRAQTGITMAGMRGQDTSIAAIGYGESVWDHTTTDAVRLLVPKLDRFINEAGSRRQGDNVTNYYTINVEADFTSPAGMQSFADDLMPMLGRSARYGTQRRTA